jgi:hypothetical protein
MLGGLGRLLGVLRLPSGAGWRCGVGATAACVCVSQAGSAPSKRVSGIILPQMVWKGECSACPQARASSGSQLLGQGSCCGAGMQNFLAEGREPSTLASIVTPDTHLGYLCQWGTPPVWLQAVFGLVSGACALRCGHTPSSLALNCG